jgi:hypothetical protein
MSLHHCCDMHTQKPTINDVPTSNLYLKSVKGGNMKTLDICYSCNNNLKSLIKNYPITKVSWSKCSSHNHNTLRHSLRDNMYDRYDECIVLRYGNDKKLLCYHCLMNMINLNNQISLLNGSVILQII